VSGRRYYNSQLPLTVLRICMPGHVLFQRRFSGVTYANAKAKLLIFCSFK